MANPDYPIPITPANTWVKVATDVTSGWVHTMEGAPSHYVHTYRDTGDAAPTVTEEGVAFNGFSEPITSSVGIDVYVMALTAPGVVRVDL